MGFKRGERLTVQVFLCNMSRSQRLTSTFFLTMAYPSIYEGTENASLHLAVIRFKIFVGNLKARKVKKEEK